jgi:peptidoglycan-associated lipoprotein
MKRILILSLVIVLTACSSLSGNKGGLSESEIAAQEAARQEEVRKQEELRQQQEAARLEAERKAEEERIAEEKRQEEMRRAEETRLAEEARIAEERRQEEIRRQEEARQREALRQQRLEDGDDPSLVGMVTEDQLRKADPLLLERSIYFAFDKYNIDPKYAPILAAHARFLIVNPTVKIFVEGNCDDRGSPEYNIALGQRRADAVQRALLTLGVPPRQIESVSFGAERPVAYGANEEAWAKNRRSDIAYPMLKYSNSAIK